MCWKCVNSGSVNIHVSVFIVVPVTVYATLWHKIGRGRLARGQVSWILWLLACTGRRCC